MATSAAIRKTYQQNSANTASQQQLLVMLYERVLRDIIGAAEALQARDLSKTNDLLCHAQEIIIELEGALDVTVWEGGPGLASLYMYIREELVAANLAKDLARIQSCRGLVEPLVEAWREAVEANS